MLLLYCYLSILSFVSAPYCCSKKFPFKNHRKFVTPYANVRKLESVKGKPLYVYWYIKVSAVLLLLEDSIFYLRGLWAKTSGAQKIF